MKQFLLSSLCLMSVAGLTQNVSSEITSRKAFASGPSVVGIFEGRGACQELAKELGVSTSPECFKTKWSLTLFQDPATLQPTAYVLEGSFYRANPRKGTWKIHKGTPYDPNVLVYQLENDNPGEPIFLLKGDDNVLFFLDKNKNLLVGNELFSYTLNRVTRKN
ncbi:MAG: hypothetical protein U0X91_05170 [Spirosomataceae bacterium]